MCPEEISSLDAFESPYLCFTLSWYDFSFFNQWTQLFHIAPKAEVAINSFQCEKKVNWKGFSRICLLVSLTEVFNHPTATTRCKWQMYFFNRISLHILWQLHFMSILKSEWWENFKNIWSQGNMTTKLLMK